MPAYLLDTNIWLRSVQREAPHHPMLTFNHDDFRQFAMITVVTPTDLLASPD